MAITINHQTNDISATSGSLTIDGASAGSAATLTTARAIQVSGAVTGTANFDGSADINIVTTNTADPVLTLAGDATGSATFTNLGNATLTVAVVDDSHNHSSSSGDFTVGGNLVVNGTTVTVNATTITIDDPIITLGGDTTPGADDNKDRGIEFKWHNGSVAKVGFFGFDDSTGYLTFIPDATNTSEVFSGSVGDIQATNFRGALVGNASTATTLETARTINSVSFDGSANITVADSTKVAKAGDTMTGNLSFGDNVQAVFGAGSDLFIKSDGSNSIIQGAGAGTTYLRGSSLVIGSNGGAGGFPSTIYVSGNSSTSHVEMNYGASKKFETTSTGIDVTGTAVTDGLTVAGNLSVDGGTIKLDGNYPVGSYNVALGDAAGAAITSGGRNTLIGGSAGDALTVGQRNVVIGTDALSADTQGSRSVAIGQAALANQNFTSATDNYNVAVGFQAGVNVSTGINNTLIGGLALTSNTTGGNNTAVGMQALQANTTASNNTAVGYQAGYSNITGTRGTYLGTGAGYSNATSGDDTAVGYNALYTNTGGANTAVGSQALTLNTTGAWNSGLGYGVLIANTSGANNVAVGANALAANTTGLSNTAVGYSAGSALTTANQNTFIGVNSGKLITTGANNTIIGAYNGNYGGLDIRTSSNNIVLSDGDGNPRVIVDSSGNVGIANAVMSSMNAGARNLVIGSGSTGQGMTIYSSTTTAGSIHFADGTVGDAAYRGQLVYNHNGDYMAILTAASERLRINSSGNVGIGTSSPASKLDIAGQVAATGGAAAAPTYSFIGDTDTGISRPTTNAVNIVTAGTERMRIDASGNVGIGTTSASEKLTVNGSINLPTINTWVRGAGHHVLQVDATKTYFYGGTGGVQFRTADNASGLVDITNAGNVGIGTSAPGTKLSNLSTRIGNADGLTTNTSGIEWALSGQGYIASLSNTSTAAPGNYNAGLLVELASTDATDKILDLESGGVNRVRVLGNGNVGIGASPIAKLSVVGGTSNASNLATAYSLATFNITPKSTSGYSLQFGSGPSDLPYIQMSAGGTASGNLLIQPYGGNVGIGTTSPSRQLTVSNSGAALLLLESTGNDNGQLLFGDSASDTVGKVGYAHSTNHMFFNTNGGERLRITDSGTLCLGTTASLGARFVLHGTSGGTNNNIQITNPGYGTGCLGVEGTSSTFKIYNCYAVGTLASGAGIDIATNGYVGFGVGSPTQMIHLNGGTAGPSNSGIAAAWNVHSDYRLKENVVGLSNASSLVSQLRPVKFSWVGEDQSEATTAGFIAHEMAEVAPYSVMGEKDAVNEDGSINSQGADYSKLVPLLTAALQEALTEITALKARVTALEGA